LQTEINYDQVRSKIYHHAPSLLVHYPVKWTKMYWPTLLVYDFVIKDATVKQVTQISIKSTLTVSSEAVVVVSSFSVETHSKSSSPLVNSFVKNRLFKRSRHRWSAVQFIHTMDLSVVDTTLHVSPDLVIHRTEIWAVWRSQVWRNKECSAL